MPSEAQRSLLMAGIGAAVLLMSVLYAPWGQAGPVLCPFRALTGLPCPGCGLTRSFCALTQGRWAHAATFHLLGPVLFLAVLAGVPLLTLQGLTRRRVPLVDRLLFSQRTAYVTAAALLIYHLARLVVLGLDGTLWADIQTSSMAIAFKWLCHLG